MNRFPPFTIHRSSLFFAMDYSVKIGLVVGLLALLAILWAVWKFFTALFKYVIIGLVVAAIGAGLTWYRMQPPPRNPNFGKHAYLKENGAYLGVVESQGDDNQRGEVWIIRPPGGHPAMYRKSRVDLKDKYEPPPSPAPEPSPAANAPARKGKKKREAGK
jgi:hypothetical protein